DDVPAGGTPDTAMDGGQPRDRNCRGSRRLPLIECALRVANRAQIRPFHSPKCTERREGDGVRRFFTTAESGRSASALRWGERKGRWQRVGRGIYGEGSEVPSELDLALAAVIRAGGVASGRLAGVLHGLDSVHLR